jgi:hypothetical protein
MMSTGLFRRCGSILVLLLLVSSVRFTSTVTASPVLRASLKRPRRCPSELPETPLARSKNRESKADAKSPLLLAAAAMVPRFGLSQASSLAPSDKVCDWLREPRALKLCLARDCHSSLAPPSL